MDPATTKSGRRGEVFLPARLNPKLYRFLGRKASRGEFLEPLRTGLHISWCLADSF